MLTKDDAGRTYLDLIEAATIIELVGGRDTDAQLMRRAAGVIRSLAPPDEPAGDPNPRDSTNNYFRTCPNGHIAYSTEFDECPSCKIERERATVNRGAEPT